MITIASHGVGSLLIGQKKNQVRFTHRVESSAYVRNEKEERQTSFGPLPRNTAWETDYAQRLEAKCWQPVEKLALTAAYACVSPTGRERERKFVFGFLHSSTAKPFLLPLGEG